MILKEDIELSSAMVACPKCDFCMVVSVAGSLIYYECLKCHKAFVKVD